MPLGRPKGSTNQVHTFPQRLKSPDNWTTEIANLRQTRHALPSEGGPDSLSDLGNMTCYKVFRLLWSDELDYHVLKRTNKRAKLHVTQTALHRFILAGLVMCQNIRTDYKKHWASIDLYENVVVKQIISRDEFRNLLHHIHPKPKSMVSLANSNFQRYWSPCSHISIDEGLICFKGRYQHRVHIRGKPDATGLKVYGLADEKSYLYAFTLYEGQSQTVPQIILDLTKQLPHSNFKLYVDSWYGSPQLASTLLENGLYFTMACGKNKPTEVFKDYLDVQLSPGQCRYLQSQDHDELLAVSYNDRTKCHFLTNLWRPGMSENRKKQQIPDVVQDYRIHMGMMDRVDRSALKATWPHKNLRWSMAFFWYLLGLCVANAHKIYIHSTQNRISLTSFLGVLISEWREVLRNRSGAQSVTRHRLILSPSKSRCEVCKHVDPNIAKTRMLCTVCNVGLHPRCYAKYHKRD